MRELRVLIADDHPLMLRSIRAVLDSEEGMDVVAEASTGSKVMPLVASNLPDVVVLDVQLPELDGFQCLDRIRSEFADACVVMLSASDHPRTAEEAMRRGARAYVVKSVPPEELVAAIRRAAEEHQFVASGLRRSATSDLTERELAVVEAVARGLSNREIASELWITEQTVKFHLGNIFRKLEVANRTEAARVLFDRGLERLPATEPNGSPARSSGPSEHSVRR
jgi:DNA-binding NarL/FixJ family response regulator